MPLLAPSPPHALPCPTIPSPGIYAVMTFPVLKRTLAIFLSPELGFFGFVVPTFKHTPLSSGLSFNWGDRSFRAFRCARPPRRTWISVHLCARDAGAGRRGRAKDALGKTAAAIDGRGRRVDGRTEAEKSDGRTRRRSNVIGMVGRRVKCWCSCAGQEFEMPE